jgi:hypothetical protein
MTKFRSFMAPAAVESWQNSIPLSTDPAISATASYRGRGKYMIFVYDKIRFFMAPVSVEC